MPPKSRDAPPNRGARGASSRPPTGRQRRPGRDVINLDDSGGSEVVITGSRTRVNEGAGSVARGGGSFRQKVKVLDVYGDMLAEAAAAEPSQFGEEGRTVKKRRMAKGNTAADGRVKSQEKEDSVEGSTDHYDKGPLPQQVAYDDFEDSEESDVDWEEVDLSKDNDEDMRDFGDDEEEGAGDLNLVLHDPNDKQKRRPAGPRRKPITAVERKRRLEVHRMHLLCLLTHVWLRNFWCNDKDVQATLRPLLSDRTVSFLNPDPERPQFSRANMFIEGLNQASALWNTKFKITARGLKRAVWAEDEDELKNFSLPEDTDLPIEKSDFRDLAQTLEGSRDVGAQLFCALLRSVDVEARLVCSLQPLPFNFIALAKDKTPQKRRQVEVIYAAEDSQGNTSEETGSVDVATLRGSFGTASGPVQRTTEPLPPRASRRLWQPDPGTRGPDLGKPPPALKVTKPKSIKESAYPIYWVEAFNVAHQKWVPVDPLVTRSVGKPSKFEPPASDSENYMSYVVAFEDEGTAKDVTRRYAKAINAKTRKMRIESRKGGSRWWKKSMKMYQNGFHFDRDQVEDAELARREASEGIPRNVQDFKDHPYYALERHLRKNEVIHPKREVGKVTTGPGLKGKGVEPIYRRSDVHQLKSADGWYRVGREIKPGEQPLKRVQRRRNNTNAPYGNDEEDGDDDMPLYAPFQTVVYEPPPVVNGRVPKNMYGNLDVYVPSMVPRGGVHLPYPEAARATRLLALPYADAVTGFSFRGRHGTAIIHGIVVAEEYADAVKAVIRGLGDEREEEESVKRSRRALRYWKQWLVGLRIRKRVQGYGGEDVGRDVDGQEVAVEGVEDDRRGSFHPERYESVWLEDSQRKSTTRNKAAQKGRRRDSDEDEEFEGAHLDSEDSADEGHGSGGGFIPEDGSTAGSFVRDNYAADDDAFAGEGGGFIPEDYDMEGGGFIPGDNVDHEGGGLLIPGNEVDAGANGRAERKTGSAVVRKELNPMQTSGDEEDVEMDDNTSGQKSPSPPASLIKKIEGSSAAVTLTYSLPTQSIDPPPTPLKTPAPPQPHLSQILTAEEETESPVSPTARHPPPPADIGSRGSDEGKTGDQSTGADDGDEKEKEKASNNDDSDHGSLLSHDPEDDDAEPEWFSD